jgi:adenylate kinase family enzyme
VGALESELGWHVLAMRKVAVFGNAGAGKSTLARLLTELTGLSLYPVDTIRFEQAAARSRTRST